MGNEPVSCVFAAGLSATWVLEPGLAPPPLQPAPWGPGESQVGQTSEVGWCFQGFVFKVKCLL